MSQTEPTTKLDHVSAHFGGQDMVFKIPRDRLEGFEAAIGQPAQSRLARIIANTASAAEIREVLEYAAPHGMGRGIPMTLAQITSATMWRGHDPSIIKGHRDSFVAKTLKANPPARYAVLAQGVIAACLYGLPASAASFDEREEASDDAA